VNSRFRTVGVLIAIVGVLAVLGGGYAYLRVQQGADALQGFSDAQGVELSYRDGVLIDRGTPEGAEAIKTLLVDGWKWPAVESELDPDDPLVDTGTEYMYQMATIAYHTLHGEQQVTLDERVEFDGDGDDAVAADAPVYTPETLPQGDAYVGIVRQDAIFEPGTYTVPVAERYWTGFNRLHPLDGPARERAWSGTVHGLFAELGVGATTASTLQLAQAVSFIAMAFGAAFIVIGLGLAWAAGGKKVTA
jgi:hypothetical protein